MPPRSGCLEASSDATSSGSSTTGSPRPSASVPAAEFGEEVLPESLNDLAWLERVARAHETVLERAGERDRPIVPLRLCTIFVDAAGVRRMLGREPAAFAARSIASRVVRNGRSSCSSIARGLEAACTSTTRRREADRAPHICSGGGPSASGARQPSGSARELAEDVHARLQDWAIDAVVNPPQSRELSGHVGDMLLNGAYLVERARAGELAARRPSSGAPPRPSAPGSR